ncbi:hypothetical protein A8E25_20435 [Burkholderia cenocepacia]|nr:hypothetical protein BURCENK562V_C5018 [Burkholderia cenocepacia K56-2Valvano]ERI28373.1 hypothetical protein BURCENBC7_AP4418 [Burkholderia cenocepacia BC7]ONR57625.1 hypothetical protein A8E23_38125 [Burkholderia cenocepacia]ONR62508.1 hypothetical protein A8E17_10230 [Burkholderia cenocepacia]ONR62713.1 hypothetical protein A8E18_32285 [Burkholderia cenocepacia]
METTACRRSRIVGTRRPETASRHRPPAGFDARPSGDLRGNRLYTLLPGRTGRASGHSLYSRRVRHP